MNVRSILAAAALTTALAAAPLTAHAATPQNVLRDFCAATVTTSCVSVLDNDEGILQVRDIRGHRHTFRTEHGALRYLRHHAAACAQEDSTRCYWDAGHVGNRRGDSFIDVGGRSGAWYLGNLSR